MGSSDIQGLGSSSEGDSGYFLVLCFASMLTCVWMVQGLGAFVAGGPTQVPTPVGGVSWAFLAGLGLGLGCGWIRRSQAVHPLLQASAFHTCLGLGALALSASSTLLPEGLPSLSLPVDGIGKPLQVVWLVTWMGLPGFLVGQGLAATALGVRGGDPQGRLKALMFLGSFSGLGALYGSLLFWPSFHFPMAWGLPETFLALAVLCAGTGWWLLRQAKCGEGAGPWPRLSDFLERHAGGMALLVGVLILARTAYVLVQVWSFSTDDAYITLRYSRHLAEGLGLTWNPGDPVPVEGYSNFLFVILGAVAQKLGWNPILLLKIVSLAALAGVLALLYLMTRPHLGPLGSMIPPLAFSAYQGTLWWSVSGMETVAFVFLSLLSIHLFLEGLSRLQESDFGGARWRIYFIGSGVGVLLASLTRPEGPIVGMTLAFGFFYGWAALEPSRPSWSGRVLQAVREFLIPCSVPYALYTTWRLAHFGRLWPNTYYWKKTLHASDPFSLVLDFLSPGLVLMALAALWWVSRRTRLGAMALFLVAGYLVMLKGVDPIIGYYNRHFLVVIALLCPPAAAGLLLAFEKAGKRLRGSLAEAVVCAGVLLVSSMNVAANQKPLAQAARLYSRRMEARLVLAQWLSARLEPGQAFAIGDSGLVPYLVHARALDLYFLNSREMTTPPVMGSVPRYVAWMLGQSPRFIVLPSARSDRMDPWPLYGVNPQILSHPAFQQYYESRTVFGAKGDDIQYWVYQRKGGS